MYMSISVLITQMVILFILILMGYVLTKLKMVDMNGSKQLSAIVSTVTNPALILSSAFTQDGSITNRDIFVVSIVSLALFLIWFLAGKCLSILLNIKKDER
jgi:predicted permease